MKYEDFAEKRLISDIAKGRYSKERVRELLDLYAKACLEKAEENIFEYCWLTLLQELRFEANYTKEQMEAFFSCLVKSIECGIGILMIYLSILLSTAMGRVMV